MCKQEELPSIGTDLSSEQVRNLAGDESQLDPVTFDRMVEDSARLLFGLADEDL